MTKTTPKASDKALNIIFADLNLSTPSSQDFGSLVYDQSYSCISATNLFFAHALFLPCCYEQQHLSNFFSPSKYNYTLGKKNCMYNTWIKNKCKESKEKFHCKLVQVYLVKLVNNS